MKAFLAWCSLISVVLSLIVYVIGSADQAIYLILLSIYLSFLATKAV